MRQLCSVLNVAALFAVSASGISTQVLAENPEIPATSAIEVVEAGSVEKPGLLAAAVKDGRAYVSARYRFEFVDQSGLIDDAKASTLRTRLGFESGRLGMFDGKIEIEDIQEVGEDLYNSTVNGRSDRPVVADPDGTEVNEAYLSMHGPDEFLIRGGREALALDNLRFVGDVGWRQNNQTYDGVNVSGKVLPNLVLFYAYVGNVNRIFGDDSAVGDWKTNLQLLNMQWKAIEELTATTYAYLFDVDDEASASSATAGLRLDGAVEVVEGVKGLYDLEYAYQQDYENNPLSYDAQYYRLEAGMAASGLTLKGGFESLGSDSGVAAFSTPFATLHKWNGWADKFLNTPATGLEDAYASFSYDPSKLLSQLAGTNFTVVYHYFSAEQSSRKYGDEWDFNLSKKFLEHFEAGVKYASYNAANFGANTEKLIFSLSASFSQ
jgi:hypothetical protein